MTIDLSHHGLVVLLYDLLHRLEDAEGIFLDTAKQQVNWQHIQAQLDMKLAEPFQADYQAIIEAARCTVREQY